MTRAVRMWPRSCSWAWRSWACSFDEAVPALQAVIGSDHALPDQMMSKYGVGGYIEVGVTPLSMVAVPVNTPGAALLLAEVYQRLGRSAEAINLLESLGSVTNEPVCALSLADLYGESEQWPEVARVTDGFTSNEDDLTLEILCRRAHALIDLGMHTGALQVLKEALRFRKRNPVLRRTARYLRGLSYEQQGKPSQARKEFERVYAEDASFLDVAERLAVGPQKPEP